MREFIYKLNELSVMVRSIDECTRVNRLWYGCSHEIQRELWIRGLNPELSDFDTVTTMAETIELASSVTECRNTGPKAENQPSDKRKGSGSMHHTGCRVQYYCLQYLKSIVKVYKITDSY